VTVHVAAAQADGVIEILDNHGPINIEERALVDGGSESTSASADTQVSGVVSDNAVRRRGISG
jgi:hypothetical protein